MDKKTKERIDALRIKSIPFGYVETPAGVLPNDWTSKSLSEISEVISEQAGDDDYETLSISAGIGFVNQAQKFGKELSGKQYEKYTVLRKGDFAYNKGNSKRYPQGCTYRLKERDEAAVPNVFECFRITEGCPEYYEQLFINGFMSRQLTRKINHGVRDDGLLNLTFADFYSTVLPVPPLAEQQKIAEVLSTCNRAIEFKQELITEKRKQKKWIMYLIFDEQYLMSDLTLELSFEEVFVTHSTRSHQIKTNQYESEGKYPVIDQGKRAIVAYSNDDKKAIDCPDTGLIVFGDHTKELKFVDFDFVIGADGVQLISAKEDVLSTEFGYYLLSSKRLPNDGYSRHFKYLKEELYVIPDRNSQDQISSVLKTIDNEICLLEEELAALQQKKKALMQLLLTGLVRTNN